MTFEATYETHYGSVVASSWAICRDREVAEELTQEAFARAYRRWRKLESGGYAVPWLHRVVMNLTISHVRRRARGAELEGQQAFAPPIREDVHSDDDWLVRVLKGLPKRQREAVFLRYVADLDVEHVAAVMRISTGSVKTHSKRGLDHLREVLPAQTAGSTVQFAATTQESPWTR